MTRAQDFQPEPGTIEHWLFNQVQGFSSREDIGAQTGLIDRMMRWFMGDPVLEFTATSSGSGNPSGLTVDARAMTAVMHVALNDIYYRTDGSEPNPAGDQLIQAGSIVTLTGQRTITAFQFISTNGEPATVYGTYYS